MQLIVDGKPCEQPFEVVKDSAIPSSDEDLVASTELQIAIRDCTNKTVDMISHLARGALSLVAVFSAS